MSCSGAGNIRIEPCDVNWEEFEQTVVKCIADVAGSLGGTYFTLQAGNNGTEYYVWFNTGASVDPAPAGKTGIEVTINANDSAAAVATALKNAVDAESDFSAVLEDDVTEVYITNAAAGDAEKTADVDTGFTIEQCAEGGSIYLGLLDGDISVDVEESSTEVFAHQTGQSLLADLRTGVTATVGLTLKESDLEKLKEMFARTAGGTFTPGGGTELFGWGDGKVGTNTLVQARKLTLHPVALATSDKSRDLSFWKAYAKPSSLVYSGENPNVLSVEFKCYVDQRRPSGINLFAFGDHTQAGITA